MKEKKVILEDKETIMEIVQVTQMILVMTGTQEEDFSREDDEVDLEFKEEIEELFIGEEEGVENKDKITIKEKKEETQSDSSEPRDELKSRVESTEDDSEATTLVTRSKPSYVEASGFRRR